MGLNFMGLGFSFGAVDTGLGPVLGSINQQFAQLNDTLAALQMTAAASLTPAEGAAKGLADAMSGMGAEPDMFDALLDPNIKQIPDVTESLGGMGDAMGAVGDAGKAGATSFGRGANAILGGAGKMVGAMGFVGMAVGPVVSGIGQAASTIGGFFDDLTPNFQRAADQITALTHEGINLTNSLEAEAVGLGQTARQVGVNMGYVGDELQGFTQRATGMAMGLNIGADQAAGAIRAWDESAETLGATGLESARDVARFTAALGINADVLRNSTLEMRNLGASSDQIQQMTSAITAMGQATGDVTGALNELPQVMQMLERRRALGESPEQMVQFATDTAAAARGLFELTQDSDRARSMASQLAETVTESSEAFANMFAGTDDQLPALATELAITGGDVNQAFEQMAGGPGALIEGMGRMVADARARGRDTDGLMTFMRGRLQQVFGPEMTATLINFWQTMDSSTVDAMASIRTANVDLGELGRQAHTTGRTMQEAFDRMREGVMTQFRRLGRPEAREWMGRVSEGGRRIADGFRALSRDDGPLGSMARMMSEASIIGGNAFIPDVLQSSAFWLGEMNEVMGPTINRMRDMAGQLTSLRGVVDLATQGWMLYNARAAEIMSQDPDMTLAEAFEQTNQEFAQIAIDFIGNAESFITDILESFATIDWDNVFGSEEGDDEGIGGAIGRVIQRLRDVDWDAMWGHLRTGLTRLMERVGPWLEKTWGDFKEYVFSAIKAWWDEIDWQEVFRELGELGSDIWEALQPAFSVIAQNIGEWFSENWDEILFWGLAALGAALVALLLAVVVGSIALLIAPFILFWATIVMLWNQFGDDLEAAWDSFIESWEESIQYMPILWNDFTTWLGELWDGVVTWFRELWDGVVAWFEGIWNNVKLMIITAFVDVVQRVIGIVTTIRETWNGVVEFFSGIMTGIEETISTAIDNVIGFFTNMGSRASEAVTGVWDTVTGIFGDSVNTVVGEDMALTEQVMTETANRVSAVMRDVLFATTVSAIVDGFRTGFDTVAEGMEDFAGTMAEAFTRLATSISSTMTALFLSVVAQAEAAMNATEAAVGGVISDLQAITAANLALARAQGQAQAARPADASAIARRQQQLAGDPILESINHPDWYFGAGGGRGGYMRLFQSEMEELRSTIRSLQVAAAGAGGGEARRERVRGARQEIESSSIGHNQPPATRGGSPRRRR